MLIFCAIWLWISETSASGLIRITLVLPCRTNEANWKLCMSQYTCPYDLQSPNLTCRKVPKKVYCEKSPCPATEVLHKDLKAFKFTGFIRLFGVWRCWQLSLKLLAELGHGESCPKSCRSYSTFCYLRHTNATKICCRPHQILTNPYDSQEKRSIMI